MTSVKVGATWDREPISVLVVDDSTTYRTLIKMALGKIAGVKVVGEAESGEMALEKIKQLAPNVVTLDRQMPGNDGLWTLEQIKNLSPATRVVMLSGAQHWNAKHTFAAFKAGAEDFLLKPKSKGSPQESLIHLRGILFDAIVRRQVGGRQLVGAKGSRGEVKVLAVGASTGGPQALEAFFSAFKSLIPVPVLVVQHIPPGFSHSLAQRLARCTLFNFKEAEGGEILTRGTALISPGGIHLAVKEIAGEVVAELRDEAPINFCKPSVDVMLDSLAEIYGDGVMSVILTGMGSDGLKGAQNLRALGATVMVQDQESSVIWGMPGAIASAGLAHKVLPLPALAREVEKSFL